MQLTVAAKQIGANWEGALIVDNKFQRAMVDPKLETLVLRGLTPMLMVAHAEGTEITINITIEEAKLGDGLGTAEGGPNKG